MSNLQKLWPYSHEDKSTWKYINFETFLNKDNKLVFKKWILNPDFKYRSYDKHHRKCTCGRII